MIFLTMAAASLLGLQDDSKLGQQDYQAGRYGEAADHFAKALEKDPKSPQLWIAFGHASLQAQRWESAILGYRQAQSLKMETADLDRALAQALEMEHRTDESIASLRRAARLDPEGNDSLTVARLYVRHENWLLAQTELLQYLARTPGSLEGWEALAFVLGRTGSLKEAEGVYRELEVRRPGEPKYRVARGRLAVSQGRYGEAIDLLEWARAVSGLQEDEDRLLADLYLQERMYAEAAECYARRIAHSERPKVEDELRLGHAYLALKDYASAEEAFRKAQALDPAGGGPALSLGHIAQARGEVARARQFFTEAQTRMPDSPQGAIALGNLELAESSWVKAAEAFQEAVRRGSVDAAVGYNLVLSWHRAERKEEAQRALKEALRLFPLDPRLRALFPEVCR